jgi:hypothetical protein
MCSDEATVTLLELVARLYSKQIDALWTKFEELKL